MLFISLTGLLLWTPWGRVAKPLWSINWKARPRRLIWEMHQVAGLYSLAFVVLLSATGAYFGWRSQVHRVVAQWFPMALAKPCVQFNRPATALFR